MQLVVKLPFIIFRSFDALWYAWKSYHNGNKEDKAYYAQRMAGEINDGLYLRLYEAFIESGPQLVLQMYILVQMQTPGPNKFTYTGKKINAIKL